jgi:tetratricopeptide (TPR) repeat protein
MSEFNSKFIKYLCLLLFLKGCAYFNTFYNAEEHFQTAERIRIENLGDEMPSMAIKEYGKAIEKSDKVLSEFHDSKYVFDAMVLKGKSHYFRREYDSAILIFDELNKEDKKIYKNEARYWLALCKWKDLKPFLAINDLESLLNDVDNKNFQSNIYLSIGEIYLSVNNRSSAFENFDKGAKLSKNRILREQIYYQIAEISFKELNYNIALNNYQKVLENTISISRIQDSNLKIVQIYRLLGDLEKSTEKIQKLIIDQDFDSIKSSLDLELTKIELSKGKLEFAIENLDRIGQDYPNTEAAIESFYILSNIYVSSPNINYEKAKFFMNEAMRQNSNSPFKVLVNKKRDDIDKLIELDLELTNLKNLERAKNLFISGQILAFNLSSYLEAKEYFENVIKNHSESSYLQQSIFALYIINKKLMNNESLLYKNRILEEFPNSDFAKYIINNDNLDIDHRPSNLLRQAEDARQRDLDSSIALYKKVLNVDKSTQSSKIAAYFLGMYYDYEIAAVDSAKYYYEFVAKQHPSSLQAEKALKRLEAINVK